MAIVQTLLRSGHKQILNAVVDDRYQGNVASDIKSTGQFLRLCNISDIKMRGEIRHRVVSIEHQHLVSSRAATSTVDGVRASISYGRTGRTPALEAKAALFLPLAAGESAVVAHITKSTNKRTGRLRMRAGFWPPC